VTALNQAVWSSVSTLYSVEHLFFQITQAGQYDFMVREAVGNGPQMYGVAWQAVPEPASVVIFTIGAAALVICRRVRRRPTLAAGVS
jgi:hypothetical protein